MSDEPPREPPSLDAEPSSAPSVPSSEPSGEPSSLLMADTLPSMYDDSGYAPTLTGMLQGPDGDDGDSEVGGTQVAPDRHRAAAGARSPGSKLPRPGDTVDHYELIRELGRGGMGVVYLARDLKLARRVAVKFIRTRDPSLCERFIAEARTTARCHHENIVVIHDINDHAGNPYMVLEYLPGRNLRELIKEKPVSPGRAVELMLPVTRALEQAHRHGIIHRDLKPENIRVTRAGVVKVLDFGIAKALTDDDPARPPVGAEESMSWIPLPEMHREFETPASAMIGTLPYMSPEQLASSQGIDLRSDLWAVGIILLELLLGRHPLAPFDGTFLPRMTALDEPMPSAADLVPGAGRLGALIDRCLIKNRDDRIASAGELVADLEVLSPERRTPTLITGGSPFTGLAAFQRDDADRFFGRTSETRSVVAQLQSQPLVTVAGPSGAGKSSLVRAGAIPTLERSGEGWHSLMVRPGRDPLGALAGLLDELKVHSSTNPETDSGASGELEVDPAAQWAITDRRSGLQGVDRLVQEPGSFGRDLRGWARRKRRRLVLFVDQFEELYTLVGSGDQRSAFLRCLQGAADDASSPLRVILAIRSDFLDRLAEGEHFSAEFIRGLVLLPPMGRDGLRIALTRPVLIAGYRFEDESLIDDMLDGLAGTPGALPLLQFAARKLWDGRDREQRQLTRECYEGFGGVVGALAVHGDAVLAGMSPARLTIARHIFERLVTPEGIRAVVTPGELRELPGDPESIDQVIHHLADARLLTIEHGGKSRRPRTTTPGPDRDRDHESAADHSTIELIHESLITRWPTLRRWLDDRRGDVEFLARVRTAARQWRESGERDGLLWRGEAAMEVRSWRARHTESAEEIGLRESEERYIAAVLALAQSNQRQRRRSAFAVIAVLAVVAVVLAYLTERASSEASRAQDEATRARNAMVRVHDEAVRARNASRVAAAELHNDDPTMVVALLRELEDGLIAQDWVGLANWALSRGVAHAVLPHPLSVLSVDFSPDGKRVVSGCTDGLVRVWSVDDDSEPLAVLRGHDKAVESVAFSPDGRRIVSASSDGSARVWRVDGAGDAVEPLVLRGHTGEVLSADFSPDGARVVTASSDQTVRLWSADSGDALLVFHGHEGDVNSAHFDPDGARIVSASDDRTIRIWPVAGGSAPRILRGHAREVRSAVFDPSGQHIASASEDGTVQIGRADGTGEPVMLEGHDSPVSSVAFRPDGRRVASASYDATVMVWSRDGSGSPQALRGHGFDVLSVRFSGDGAWLASASADSTVRIWRVSDERQHLALRGHDGPVIDATFSPDGERIASCASDATVRLWSSDGRGEPRILTGHTSVIMDVAFRPDGEQLASASWDRTIRLWSLDDALAGASGGLGERAGNPSRDDATKPRVLEGHEAQVASVAYHPDGTRLVSGSADRTVRVWSLDGQEPPVVLRGHEDTVVSVAFSPDGERIVSTSFDRSARVWSADGKGERLVLSGHADRVWMGAFSPDGERIVTASSDGTIAVWNADGSGSPLILRGHAGLVHSAVFSPDGARILSSSTDRTLRVWNADGSGTPLVLRGHDDKVNRAGFSPDGKRVVSASYDKQVLVWRLPESIERDDPSLWRATRYCPPVEQRRRFLGVSQEMAEADDRRCRARVTTMHDP